MSALAYSELLKRITGIEDKDLERPFLILSKNNTTTIRLDALKMLAVKQPISLGKLLHSLHVSRGGGSYLTIRKYFLLLEKEGLLCSITEKNRTLWSFSEKGKILQRYILS